MDLNEIQGKIGIEKIHALMDKKLEIVKRAKEKPWNIDISEVKPQDWILWKLYEKEPRRWSDFLSKPYRVNQSILSNIIEKLMKGGFIKREYKEYYLTALGKSKLFAFVKQHGLNSDSIVEDETRRIKTNRKIGYPPKKVLQTENYEYILLWILNNNEVCSWMEFRNIFNNNVKLLDNAIGTLLCKRYIEDRQGFEDILYRITPFGIRALIKIQEKLSG